MFFLHGFKQCKRAVAEKFHALRFLNTRRKQRQMPFHEFGKYVRHCFGQKRVIGTNASVDNGTDNVVIGYQSSTRDDRGTIAGSMSVGTNSVGAALGIISR